jgi:hypothetical protein
VSKRDKVGTWASERVSRQSLRYDMALRAGSVPARKDSDLKGQSRRYAEATAAVRQKELAAREVLMRHGLFRTQFMPYFRFVRSLYKAARLYSGEDFRFAAEAATARWAGQGCSREILREILFNVFNVTLSGNSE